MIHILEPRVLSVSMSFMNKKTSRRRSSALEYEDVPLRERQAVTVHGHPRLVRRHTELLNGIDAAIVDGDAASSAAHANVLGVLSQLRREWSDEGEKERTQSFGVALEALARQLPG